MKTLFTTLVLTLTFAASASAQFLTDVAYTAANRKRSLTAIQERAAEPDLSHIKFAPTAATVRLESEPSANAMAVYYTLPAAEGAARLELTDMLTGQIIFAGQIQAPGGEVRLPVQNPAGDYEARLITNHDAIARRLRP